MVPKFYEFFRPVLTVLEDGKVYSKNEIVRKVKDIVDLSDKDLQERLKSGQLKYRNRISWAITYLVQSGLIERVEKGQYRITPRGREALKYNRDLDLKYLEQFAEYRNFRNRKNRKAANDRYVREHKEKTPMEIIEEQIDYLQKELKSGLMDMVLGSPPEFFEKLVIDLLLAMNYGGSSEEMSRRLGRTGDEGVDGVIKEDPLGLDSIYIQAKRWRNKSVGRPELQQFVGALAGKGARKGVFITTSTFTDGARRYVEDIINRQKDNMVILIDGDKLLDLMIQYGVGVNTNVIYEIKRVDSDYFSED